MRCRLNFVRAVGHWSVADLGHRGPTDRFSARTRPPYSFCVPAEPWACSKAPSARLWSEWPLDRRLSGHGATDKCARALRGRPTRVDSSAADSGDFAQRTSVMVEGFAVGSV